MAGRPIRNTNPTKIAGCCAVFAESDLVHKPQIRRRLEDIIAGLYKAVVTNHLNNVGNGRTIAATIAFQSGVSKNVGVVKAFADATGREAFVDDEGYLMGVLGSAILARKCGRRLHSASMSRRLSSPPSVTSATAARTTAG